MLDHNFCEISLTLFRGVSLTFGFNLGAALRSNGLTVKMEFELVNAMLRWIRGSQNSICPVVYGLIGISR